MPKCSHLGFVILLLITSCRLDEVENRDAIHIDQVVFSVEEQSSEERTWKGASFDELFSVPFGPEVQLYYPGRMAVDKHGNLYVADLSTFQTFQFDSTGKHVRLYGVGIGDGPGEMVQLTNIGVGGDSIVYMFDHFARKILYFGMDDAKFIGSRLMGATPMMHQITDEGREYTLFFESDSLFESRKGMDVTHFGQLTEEDRGSGSSLSIGALATHKEDMVYAPVYFPVLVRYDSEGTVVFSRTTMSYTHGFKGPKYEQVNMGFGEVYQISGEVYHSGISVSEGKIFVYLTLQEPDGGQAMDVYDVETGDYEFSFWLPRHPFPQTIVGGNRLYQLHDSTVIISTVHIQ